MDKLNVLMIEDVENDALLIKREIDKYGFKTDSRRVESREGMLAALNVSEYDIILSDFRLPNFSAKDALLIAKENTPDTPFIVISGNIGEQTAVEIMKLGAQDYIMKDNLARLGPVIDRELKEADLRKEKRRAEREIILSARQWQETFNNIGDMILIISTERKIIQANRAAKIFFDCEAPEGMYCYQLINHNKNRHGLCSDNCILELPEGEDYSCQEHHWDDKWLEIRAYPITCDNGNTERYIMTIRDFTEKHNSDIALKETESQLRQSEKLQAIGQLAGGVAHDFNNQLTGIMGYAEIISNTTNESKIREYSIEILKSASHAADLTSQLLAFSRKGKYLSEPCNIHNTIEDVIKLLSHSVDKRITLRTELKALSPYILGDHSQLQSALLNLGINACDAMPEGGLLTIATSQLTLVNDNDFNLPEGPYLQLNISDTGTGIPEENFDKIFDPFFTTKPIGKGTGLGLSAVYGTIELHKGSITFTSEQYQGTCFTILLPLITQNENLNTNSNLALHEDLATVLVIDDEMVVCQVAQNSLQNYGYRTMFSTSGSQALKLYRENYKKIDAIILDMVMPGMTGKEVFYELKRINPNAKIIVSSGYTPGNDTSLLINDGAIDFLQKPFRSTQLIKTIESIVKANKREGENTVNYTR